MNNKFYKKKLQLSTSLTWNYKQSINGLMASRRAWTLNTLECNVNMLKLDENESKSSFGEIIHTHTSLSCWIHWIISIFSYYSGYFFSHICSVLIACHIVELETGGKRGWPMLNTITSFSPCCFIEDDLLSRHKAGPFSHEPLVIWVERHSIWDELWLRGGIELVRRKMLN